MRYATAVQKLRVVAEALADDARIAALLGAGTLPIVAAYAFGPLLDDSDHLDAAEVAFVVDRPGKALPWGAEPAEVRSFVERHRLGRFPLRWFCRPVDAPVSNHRIRRPVLIWSAEHGPHEAVLDVLAARQVQDLPRLAEADPEELARQLEEEAAVCLAELDALVHSGPVDARSIASELFDLAWGYTDLRRGLAALRGEPSPVAAAQGTAHVWSMEGYAELRGAARRGDGQAVVDLLGERPLDEVAQVAGEGLLVASAQGVGRAAELAERCVAALRKRGWRGDEELADELDAARDGAGDTPTPPGSGATPMRRAVPVDLDELAMHLEGDGFMGEGMQLQLATGDFWPATEDLEALTGEEPPDDWDDPDAWLYVEPQGSRDGYRDMERFTATVADPRLVDRLERALEGRGVFRRFRDILRQREDEWDRWLVFSDERTRGRARRWLAMDGYRPALPGSR